MGEMPRLIAISLALVVPLAAACAGDTSIPAQTPATASVDVGLSDYRFAPATVTVEAGVPLQLNLRNSGSVPHNWTVLASDIAAESELEETMILFTGEALAGALNTYPFDPPPAGEYQVICTIPTHFSLGMTGSLVVKTP